MKRSDAQIGDSAILYKTVNLQSAPRWRGLAGVADTGETAVNVKFQSQTVKVARYCVQKAADERMWGRCNGT